MDAVESGINDAGNWWQNARLDLLDRLLSKYHRGKRILSVGSGTAEELDILDKYGKVDAIDVVVTSKRVKKGSVTKIPSKAAVYDTIVLLDVLEHVKDHKKACKEMHRVLKKGGRIIMTVPAIQWIFGEHDRALGHHRRYSKRTLRLVMKDFSTFRFTYWNSFLSLPVILSRKLRKSKGVDKIGVASGVDRAFELVLRLENSLIGKGFGFPLGISLVGVIER